MDLFRCSMSAGAGPAVAKLYTPDENGRVYCGQGKYTDYFEQMFAKATGLSRAPLGVNSCSTAIDLALHMIGVGPGDEVICSPLTCTATNGAVVTRGAKIVWADISGINGNILASSVGRLITKDTKAVIAVDWAGRTCDYVGLHAEAMDIPIIEDAAHRLSAPRNHGDYVAWSFGPIKHLTTGGYGGALLTPPVDRKRGELLRWHGLDRTTDAADFRCEQDIKEVGYRYHMTDDQAVTGIANLDLALYSVRKARENAAWYYTQFVKIPGIVMPSFQTTCDYWLCGMIIENDRDGFMQRMKDRGIPTSRVHARNDKHTAFAAASEWRVSSIGTDYFDAHQVNIPVGWWITPEDRQRVADAVRESVSSGGTLVGAASLVDPSI